MENCMFLAICKKQTCLEKEGGNQISMLKAMSDKENMQRDSEIPKQEKQRKI